MAKSNTREIRKNLPFAKINSSENIKLSTRKRGFQQMSVFCGVEVIFNGPRTTPNIPGGLLPRGPMAPNWKTHKDLSNWCINYMGYRGRQFLDKN